MPREHRGHVSGPPLETKIGTFDNVTFYNGHHASIANKPGETIVTVNTVDYSRVSTSLYLQDDGSWDFVRPLSYYIEQSSKKSDYELPAYWDEKTNERIVDRDRSIKDDAERQRRQDGLSYSVVYGSRTDSYEDPTPAARKKIMAVVLEAFPAYAEEYAALLRRAEANEINDDIATLERKLAEKEQELQEMRREHDVLSGREKEAWFDIAEHNDPAEVE